MLHLVDIVRGVYSSLGRRGSVCGKSVVSVERVAVAGVNEVAVAVFC